MSGNISGVDYSTANYFVGTLLGDVVGTASAAGNVTIADQPLITSLGSLTSLYSAFSEKKFKYVLYSLLNAL